ncbi:MAG: L,D-transpeptidase [Rhizobiaceae bacterium]|jgi:lipoprotein-anchoring transpeptidase ErfK/SrfK|nr:L,D-transpeptidase [Rhizobiaceae bacterium]
MDRRTFSLALLSTALLAGCSSISRDPSRQFRADYGARKDGEFALPAIPVRKIDKKYLRQIVDFETKEKPGTIIVDVPERHLYLVQPGGRAVRYGVGVGKQGFAWSGNARVGWKREWPTWTPPSRMIGRRPELAKWRGGMPPGVNNPLGARALYLTKGGRDTLYRLHGTPEWWSIGKAMSSGCIRLMNQDIIDLHARVQPGAKVIVRQS